MKVLFIGHPGSGKTYAASKLATLTGTKEIDIDVLLDNLVYFFFVAPYRKALTKLLKEKPAWIIDGYAGRRMPASIWDEADHIVYINLSRSELTHNVWSRYVTTKARYNSVHGQHLFVNVLKNLWQIYVHDHSLKARIQTIRGSANAAKLIEVHSRDQLANVIETLASKM